MELSLYYLPWPQTNTLPSALGVTHLDTIQTATISSLELRYIRGPQKKLIEPEKVTKILE